MLIGCAQHILSKITQPARSTGYHMDFLALQSVARLENKKTTMPAIPKNDQFNDQDC